MDRLAINIGLFGSVSVGKSTFLNAIAGQHYSDTEIKKTTMVPQVYVENIQPTNTVTIIHPTNTVIQPTNTVTIIHPTNTVIQPTNTVIHPTNTVIHPTNATIIRNANRKVNESVLKMIDLDQFTFDQCQPIYHQIDRICDLFDPSIINPNIKINIYDIPGLNDSASKNIYFEWVKLNIKIFDIIIFMTDITRGLNNSDEIEIMRLLMGSMPHTQSRMICLMNKCDDIYFDEAQKDLVFEETEQENIYIQANNILLDIARSYNLGQDRYTPFIPISSENCFIYRALKVQRQLQHPHQVPDLDPVYQNRLCKNECGVNQWKKMNIDEREKTFHNILANLDETYYSKILDTGYLSVKSIIQNTIISNINNFIVDRANNDIKNLLIPTIENVTEYIDLISKHLHIIQQIGHIMGETSYQTFWSHIQHTINNYISFVLKINIRIVTGYNVIDFKDFNNLHSTMQNHCINFKRLRDYLKLIDNYPAEFMAEKEAILINRLISIYEQLCLPDFLEQIHVLPGNLLCYLQIIKELATTKHFECLSQKFLGFICHNHKSTYYVTHENDIVALIKYVYTGNPACHKLLQRYVCKIIINKQYALTEKPIETLFYYLLQLKILLRNIINRVNANNLKYDVYSLNILYEVIKKNISLILGNNGIYNIYKQVIDYDKVNTFMATPTNNNQITMIFEQNLLLVFD